MKQIHYTYLVVNNCNGRYYIGKHSTHKIDDGYMGSGRLLKQAIQRYGIENFEKTILDYHPSVEDCFKAEEELIAMHINDPDCYNLVPGGEGHSPDGSPRNRVIYQFSKDGEFMCEHKSVSYAARSLGVESKMGSSYISKAANGHRITAFGYKWSYSRIWKGKVSSMGKKIEQLTMEGDVIKTWNSVREAASSLGKFPNELSRCINGKRDSAYGFKWRAANVHN